MVALLRLGVVALPTTTTTRPLSTFFTLLLVFSPGRTVGTQGTQRCLGSSGDQARETVTHGGSGRGRTTLVKDLQDRLDGTIVSTLQHRCQVVAGVLSKVELHETRQGILSFRLVLGHDPFPQLVHDPPGENLSVLVGEGAQSLNDLGPEFRRRLVGEPLDQRLLDVSRQFGLWRRGIARARGPVQKRAPGPGQ